MNKQVTLVPVIWDNDYIHLPKTPGKHSMHSTTAEPKTKAYTKQQTVKYVLIWSVSILEIREIEQIWMETSVIRTLSQFCCLQ